MRAATGRERLAGARASLRILDEHLHRFDGAVVAERREGGGTRLLARWKSSPR
jgi:hypothetical protein